LLTFGCSQQNLEEQNPVAHNSQDEDLVDQVQDQDQDQDPQDIDQQLRMKMEAVYGRVITPGSDISQGTGTYDFLLKLVSGRATAEDKENLHSIAEALQTTSKTWGAQEIEDFKARLENSVSSYDMSTGEERIKTLFLAYLQMPRRGLSSSSIKTYTSYIYERHDSFFHYVKDLTPERSQIHEYVRAQGYHRSVPFLNVMPPVDDWVNFVTAFPTDGASTKSNRGTALAAFFDFLEYYRLANPFDTMPNDREYANRVSSVREVLRMESRRIGKTRNSEIVQNQQRRQLLNPHQMTQLVEKVKLVYGSYMNECIQNAKKTPTLKGLVKLSENSAKSAHRAQDEFGILYEDMVSSPESLYEDMVSSPESLDLHLSPSEGEEEEEKSYNNFLRELSLI